MLRGDSPFHTMEAQMDLFCEIMKSVKVLERRVKQLEDRVAELEDARPSMGP